MARYSEVTFACGGRLELSDEINSGEFNSPNYPESYPQNVDCIWVITAPSTERIQLEFDEDISIEPHDQ